MTIASRPYADEDLPRLQAALAGWWREAGSCGYCHVGDLPHRIYEDLRGRRPVGELVRVWEGDSGIAGVAISLRFGVAFDVFASPALRGTDAELAMLQSAYDTTLRFMAKAAGGDTWVITDVYSCDGARAELLARLGFERYRLFDRVTERSLDGAIRAPELPDGFTIRSATMGDSEQLAAVRNSCFATDWSARTYRDEVMTKPGYDPDRELVVVAPDGRVAAFTVTWLDEVNRVGHFEPVGTHRDFRRRGLARALLLHGLLALRRSGMETATIEHDASNLTAARLYASLGFEKKYEILGFRRSGRRVSPAPLA
jgi:mycothiol synthase